MNISSEEISEEEYCNREKLYEYYFDLLEVINGKKKEIKPKELKELITSTKIQTLLDYIKELLPLFINKKIEESKTNKKKQNYKSSDKIIYNQLNENQLIKYENQIRFYLKKIFQLKLEKESLGNKIQHLLKIENEFREMKEKLKYKEGFFLDNDRKENEIEILRRENSNIKKAITKIEEENKNLKLELLNDQTVIKEQKEKITSLTKKIEDLKKKFRESNNNSSINININNNGKSISKWIFKRNIQLKINNSNITNEPRALSSRRKIMLKNGNKKKIGLSENTFSQTSFNKKINNISSEKSTSPRDRIHNKTNSMNMKLDKNKNKDIVNKYFTNNNKIDFSKLSKLIKGVKYSKQFKSIFSSRSKLNDCKTEKNNNH
jgi:hypothetical protein